MIFFACLPGSEAQLNLTLQLQNPACGGFSSGKILVIPVNGNAPYTYLWNTGSTANPLQNIPAGTYTVTVTDFQGATATATGTLTEPPPLSVAIVVTDCGLPGTMEGVVTGGIMPYSYQWSTGETTSTITDLQPNLYCLTVTDINSCAYQLCESIATPMALTVNTTNATCGETEGGTADVFVTGGNLPYKYSWSNGGTNDTIFNLPPATYEVTVTADNGCTETQSGMVGLDTGSYQINFEVMNPGCSGTSTGSISASGEGGFSPYQFIWSTGDTATVIDSLPAGTYYVTATDGFGCVEEDSVTLVTSSSINLDLQFSNPVCQGSADGSVWATPMNGTPPYSFLWTTGDTTEQVGGLAAGTYAVFVIDSLGCLAADSIILTDPPAFTAQISPTNASQCGEADGAATVTASGGGSMPYTFLWNTGDTLSSLDSLPVGLYTVTVTSDEGCTATASSVISSPDSLFLTINGVDEICVNTTNGELTALPNNGNAPFKFLWSTGDSTQTISDLPAGTYQVMATSNEGCVGTASATITPTAPPLAVSIDGTAVVCWNETNGELTAASTTGNNPFSYLWSNGATMQTVSGLAAGNYAVTVTDDEGCTGTATTEIEENPPISSNASILPVRCFGLSNGAISLSIGGGTSPLSILWENGSNSTIRNNLAAGNYSYSVTDAIGCTISNTVTVSQPDPLTINFNSSAGSCDSNGFSIAIVTGGNAPYNYLWSTGATTTFIDNLDPGNYSLTVTDDKNCTKSATVTILPYPDIQLSVISSNTTCNGTSNGAATANATGGTPPYSYLWSNGETSSSINDLTFGTYSVTVTDATDCTATGSAAVILGSGLGVSIDDPGYVCPGETAFATAIAVGGNTNYSYNWSDGQTGQTALNLSSGTYSVTVTDQNGCSGEASTTLQTGGGFSVGNLVTDVSCFGESTGKINLTVQGGLSPYIYSWSNGGNTASIQNLSVGDYSVTVSDQSSCTQVYDFSVTEPSLLEMEVSGKNGVCGNQGSANATIEGGTMPYFYQWSNGNTNPSISALLPGTYSLTVTDAKGCTQAGSTTVATITPPSCDVVLSQPVTSINGSNGAISGVPSNGTTPYSYLWSNGQDTPAITGIGAGNYELTVTDADNCTTVCTISLSDGARIGDFVWEDANENGVQDAGEFGLADVVVDLAGTDDLGNPVSSSTQTDPSGNYFFDVAPGNYHLTFQVPAGYLPSPSMQGNDPAVDSDADPVTNQTMLFNVSSSSNFNTIDAGFYLEINCDNVTAAGEICCDQTLCAPGEQPTTLEELASPAGGTGTLQYVWMSSEQSAIFDPATWDTIPNSDVAELTPDNLSNTTYFVRRVRRNGCSQFLESNVVEVLVNDFPAPEIIGPDTICIQVPGSFTTSDYGGNASYNWNFPDATPNSATTRNAPDITWETTGDQTVSLTIVVDGCQLTDTSRVYVTDHPDTCGYDLILRGMLTDTMAVLLDWFYPQSSNIIRTYLVEWSTDNNLFTPLGPPDSTAQANNLTQYFHLHETPVTGSNFYRVILNDSEGNQLVSNVVEIIKEPSTGGDGSYYLVHSFPNPFKDKITIDVYDRFEGLPITVELINPLGQILYFSEIPVGMDRFEIETADFASGTYFLFVRYGGKPQKIYKLVK